MSRGTRVAGGIVAAGIFGAACWWLVGNRGPSPVLPPPDAPSAPATVDGVAGSGAGGFPSFGSAPSGEAAESEASSDSPVADAAPDGVAVPCRVEYQSTERRPARFRFQWRAEGEPAGEPSIVEGADGAATARFPSLGRYRLFGVWADGLEFPEAERIVVLAEGDRIVLRLREAASLVLLARDAVTKAPVRDARAWIERGSRPWSDPDPHTVPDPKDLAEGPIDSDPEGRIRLPPATGSVRAAVRAPGTAWTRVRVHPSLVLIPVDLVPGGAAILRVENWKDLEDVRVFMGPLEESTDAVPGGGAKGDEEQPSDREEPWNQVSETVPAPGEDGTVLLEGLPCGRRRFDVRRGDTWQSGDLYGTATCVIAAGATTEVTVRTTPTSAGRRVPLSGALTFPEEWGPLVEGELSTVEVQGLESTNAAVDLYLGLQVPGQGRTLFFVADPVPPGRYRIQFAQFGWGAEFAVAEGAPRPEWTLPVPAKFRLRILDADSLKPVTDASFRARGTRGFSAWSPRADPGGEPGEHVVLLPPGAWEITTSAEGYEDRTVRVEATDPTEVRRTVALRGGATLDIVVRFDGKPWTDRVDFKIERVLEKSGGFQRALEEKGDEVGGLTTGMSTGREGGSATFRGVGPGEWTVSIEELAGFEPVAPRTVTLRRGEKVDVVFDLERKK